MHIVMSQLLFENRKVFNGIQVIVIAGYNVKIIRYTDDTVILAMNENYTR